MLSLSLYFYNMVLFKTYCTYEIVPTNYKIVFIDTVLYTNELLSKNINMIICTQMSLHPFDDGLL